MDPSPSGLETDLREWRRARRVENLRTYLSLKNEEEEMLVMRLRRRLMHVAYEYPYSTVSDEEYGDALRDVLKSDGWRGELYTLASRAFSIYRASVRSEEFKEAMRDVDTLRAMTRYQALSHYILLVGSLRLSDRRDPAKVAQFLCEASSIDTKVFSYYDTGLIVAAVHEHEFSYKKFWEKATRHFPGKFEGVETMRLMHARLAREADEELPDPA